jgi:hypothetical protein
MAGTVRLWRVRRPRASPNRSRRRRELSLWLARHRRTLRNARIAAARLAILLH